MGGVTSRAIVDVLPIPAIVTRDRRCIAANRAYLEMMSIDASAVVGRHVSELIPMLIAPVDRAMIERVADAIADARTSNGVSSGDVWCELRDGRGRGHAVRVLWRPSGIEHETLVLFFDAEPEAFGRNVADALARTAGQLGSCANEGQVLERAVEALSERGLTATVLLIVPGDPLLRYGPTRSPTEGAPRTFERERPPRSILEAFNPGFSSRRAAFFQDGMRLVRDAYSEPIAAELAARLPSQRMVQAPLFVDQEPYGALVVTGELLTPQLVGAIELFGELVARAIENIRSRQARVERERLAALGEAAAVMAHEVRNPVAALLNAVAILHRTDVDPDDRQQMIRIIAEEAVRLERLVEDLLALGRPLSPRLATITLEDVREHALALLARRGDVGALHIEAPAPPGPMLVHADENLLQIAMMNVVLNAAQSSPPSGRVRISFAEAEGARALVIEDEGRGFSPEAERRLSEPFFTTRPTGTGMGLAVVRRMLDAHGGRLEIGRSQALGGARVALWVPSP